MFLSRPPAVILYFGEPPWPRSGALGLKPPGFCETQWRQRKPFWMGTRWQESYIKPPPPYFIVLASSVTTTEVKAIEFHRIRILVSVSSEHKIRNSCPGGLRLSTLHLGLRDSTISNLYEWAGPAPMAHSYRLGYFSSWLCIYSAPNC